MNQNKTLKQIRINALQYSEKDMASKLGMSLTDYRKIENRPLELRYLLKLAQAVGKKMEELINAQKAEFNFKIDNAFQTVDEFKNKLHTHIKQVESMDGSLDTNLQELIVTINKMTRKPRVALVGRSDVGKSTLINCLIGSKTLPEAWTPTTSIIVYVKHKSDRPEYCNNNVMIFKTDNDVIWDDTRLSDEEYTKSFLIKEGDYTTLRDYGTRQGSRSEDTEASSAVVFVESDILKNCDLLDLPGYGTNDREEDDSLLKKVQNVDILIYMSLANGFMRGEDINWLQEELPNLAPIVLSSKQLKPLSNLYIVASQAHTVSNGSIDDLKNILQKGADRFEKTLSPNYWENLGQAAEPKDFRNRFFTYSTDQASLRADFETDIRNLLLKLPEIIKSSIVDYVKDYANSEITRLSNSLRALREIISKREEKKKKLKEIEANEPQRNYEFANERNDILKIIEDFSRKASSDITNNYNKTLTIENIITIIEENNWTKKDENVKQLITKLSNLLNDSYASVIKEYSTKLSDEINKFLEHFESSAKISSNENDIVVGAGFNVKASFASGLAGLVTYGALSLWAANLGNLGAYILVAKGVSALASIGISVGGTAAASAAISAIGGPIVLIIGISAILAALVYAIFSGRGWEKRLSEKIVKEYDKKRVLDNYISQNSKYWDDTEKAFNKAADKLNEDFEKYIAALRKEVYESNDDDLNAKIASREYKIKVYNSLLKKIII